VNGLQVNARSYQERVTNGHTADSVGYAGLPKGIPVCESDDVCLILQFLIEGFGGEATVSALTRYSVFWSRSKVGHRSSSSLWLAGILDRLAYLDAITLEDMGAADGIVRIGARGLGL
jgi:hypothetical protein